MAKKEEKLRMNRKTIVLYFKALFVTEEKDKCYIKQVPFAVKLLLLLETVSPLRKKLKRNKSSLRNELKQTLINQNTQII